MPAFAEALIRFTVFFVVFALFHSITAQEWFKEKLAAVTGEFFVENFWRVFYCIISFLLLKFTVTDAMLAPHFTELVFFHPIWVYNILPFVFFSGLVIIYWAFVQVDYFEFWGLRQAYRGIRILLKKEDPVKADKIEVAGVDRLEIKGIYHFCRHPMLTGGFLMIVGSPPTISTLSYAGLIFIYMIVGSHYEEKRLHKNIGPAYAQYCKEVGGFFPNLTQIMRWIGLSKTTSAEGQ